AGAGGRGAAASAATRARADPRVVAVLRGLHRGAVRARADPAGPRQLNDARGRDAASVAAPSRSARALAVLSVVVFRWFDQRDRDVVGRSLVALDGDVRHLACERSDRAGPGAPDEREVRLAHPDGVATGRHIV